MKSRTSAPADLGGPAFQYESATYRSGVVVEAARPNEAARTPMLHVGDRWDHAESVGGTSASNNVDLERVTVDCVAIESNEEARREAEAIIADVASGQPEAGDVFAAMYASNPRDAWRIWCDVVPMLNDAVKRLRAGDTSPETLRVVAFTAEWIEQMKALEAEKGIAKAEREAERRAATLVAIQPAPDIAHRMRGVGLHDLPLPDDVEPDGDFLATHVADAEGLMAFYIGHLRATGWTLDLNHSRALTTPGKWQLPPTCYFSRPDLPGRYVEVLSARADDPERTQLLIREHNED